MLDALGRHPESTHAEYLTQGTAPVTPPGQCPVLRRLAGRFFDVRHTRHGPRRDGDCLTRRCRADRQLTLKQANRPVLAAPPPSARPFPHLYDAEPGASYGGVPRIENRSSIGSATRSNLPSSGLQTTWRASSVGHRWSPCQHCRACQCRGPVAALRESGFASASSSQLAAPRSAP